jgi:hypothetical protein
MKLMVLSSAAAMAVVDSNAAKAPKMILECSFMMFCSFLSG